MTKHILEAMGGGVITQPLDDTETADRPTADERVPYHDLARAAKIKRQFMMIIGRERWTETDEQSSVRRQMRLHGPESFDTARGLENLV